MPRIFRLFPMVVAITAALGLTAAGNGASQTGPSARPAPADVWNALQNRALYPCTLPLPPSHATAIDGVYVKQEPLVSAHVPCRRCPD